MITAAMAAMLLAPALAAAAPGPAAAAPGPAGAPEYWFDAWRVPQLWRDGARGQRITIAEIDTGVNAALPELQGRVLPGADFGASGGDGRTDREINEFGHGTAMASIMVGRSGVLGMTGLAPAATVLPIAVPLAGTTGASADDHLPRAIRWAADHGAKIISMSLGGSRTQGHNARSCPDSEQQAIFHALSKGAVLFASSGNRGTSDNAVEEPGVCLGVVSVGAVDQRNTVATFSSRHAYLTMSAPGVDVASLGRVPGSVYSGDGTSQATAIASAAAALVWSKYPTLSGRALVTRLLATLDHRRASPDPAYGLGILNAYRAVTASVPANATNPVYATAEPFLARARALQSPQPSAPPTPARQAPAPPGTVAVDAYPRLATPQVIHGLLVSGAGLAALLVLAVIAVVRRRTRARALVVIIAEHGPPD